MSVSASQSVWQYSKAAGSTLLVLLALADYANANFEAWPSQSTLARLARVTDRQVRKALCWLVEAGELAVVRKGPRGVIVYRITCGISEGRPLTPELQFRPEPQFQSPRNSSSSHPGTPVPTNHQGTPKEPSQGMHDDGGRLPGVSALGSGEGGRRAKAAQPKQVSASEIDLAFSQFWKRYPSRGSHSNPRKPAAEQFAAAMKRGVNPSAIIRGAENYAATLAQRPADPQYVAQAVTWLRQERWNDYQEQPAPPRQDDGLC